ncbi:nucleic acid/nucleotide deaminase domain-containing protein [Streptomyces sp. NBC_00304]|uniref:nucleic acid/nucleotide deaminase domain-containing protein n=1 Tax=Streptomyces sp. NBC_00304 TaxID=2975706 RepID=UPI002E2935BB|nr:nucleic acid/nucleotide deaminase domain-containing protein [Streptomyces sp. NBC_00304]
MGKKLPDELVEVLELVGVQWPNIDEDEVRGCAKDYRHLAEGLRDVVKEGNDACAHIVGGRSKGRTVSAIDRRWGKLTTKDLATFAKALDELAGALDDCAGLIEGCKVACIAELSTTAAAATVGVIGMFFTAGISGLLSAGAIALCRIALHEAIDYAVGEITSIVTDKIEAMILSKIEDVFTDHLDAEDENLTDYAAGSSDMAQDLVIEFDEFDRATGGYRKTRDNFDEKKGAHKAGGVKRRSSVKKDSRFHKLATIMEKAEDAVDKKADETVDVLEKHGGKIDKSKNGHKEEEERRKREFEGCEDAPMYILNADGSIDKLLPSGTIDPKGMNGEDKLNLVNITENGKVWRPRGDKERREWNTPGNHTGKVSSTKVNPDTNELARATQLARKAHNYYQGKNYAAGRYIDPKSGRESILIGRSEGGFHSEKQIGHPLLHTGNQSGLKEMFTEREPCQKTPQCNRWLDYYFKRGNPDLTVTYAAAYDQSDPKTQGKEHAKYVSGLRKAHGR